MFCCVVICFFSWVFLRVVRIFLKCGLGLILNVLRLWLLSRGIGFICVFVKLV